MEERDGRGVDDADAAESETEGGETYEEGDEGKGRGYVEVI